MRMLFGIAALMTVAVRPCEGGGSGATAGSRPHVVMILTDDLGWNSMYNNDDIHSPTINALASSGVKLTAHYTYRYCSPTRAAFLTGRSPFKLLNIRENLIPYTIPEATDTNFTMLPRRLREAGYISYQVGKWHQGLARRDWTPVGRGFASSFGFLGGGEDHYTQINSDCVTNGVHWSVTDYWQESEINGVRRGGPITSCDVPKEDRSACPMFTVLSANETRNATLARCAAGEFINCATDGPDTCYQCKPKRYTAFDFTSTAVTMINDHDIGTPMFMYLALHNTHGPVEAPDEFKAMYSFPLPLQNTFDAMVSVVDSTVANVTVALKASGMWDTTLLIWTTDNGSPCEVGGSNAPLRGNKAAAWEGGTRVPAFIAGGAVPQHMAGKTLNGIVAIWDLFSTIITLAGIDPADPNANAPTPVDGIDMWPYLSGAVDVSPRTEIVFDHLMFHRPPGSALPCNYEGVTLVSPCNGTGAIRVGDWKLYIGTHGMAGHYGHFSPNASFTHDLMGLTMCSLEHPCLFNVSEPNGETEDMAVAMPHVVESLKQRFASYNNEYHPPSVAPASETSAYCDAALHNGGFLTPWR